MSSSRPQRARPAIERGLSSLRRAVSLIATTLGRTPQTNSLWALSSKDDIAVMSEKELVCLCAGLERAPDGLGSSSTAQIRDPIAYWRKQVRGVISGGGRLHLIDWLGVLYDSYWYADVKGLTRIKDPAAWLQSRVNARRAIVRRRENG